MPKIIIRRANGIYIADCSQASDAAEVLRLFGTYEIPTAFTSIADPVKVLAAIGKLNPGHVVIMEGGK